MIESDDTIEVRIPERSLIIVGVQGKRLGLDEVHRVLDQRKKVCERFARERKGARERFSEGAKPATSASLGAFVE